MTRFDRTVRVELELNLVVLRFVSNSLRSYQKAVTAILRFVISLSAPRKGVSPYRHYNTISGFVLASQSTMNNLV